MGDWPALDEKKLGGSRIRPIAMEAALPAAPREASTTL
jgi:hypothetical protein